MRLTSLYISYESVRWLVTVCSVKTFGPRSFIFGMHIGLGDNLLIFYISGSKVKVNYPQKCAISGPILVTEVRCGVSWDQGGSGGVLLAACQPFLASCILPNVVGQQGVSSRTMWKYWQGASVAGKVPNSEKVLGRSIV